MSGSIQILRQELPLTDDQAQLMDIVLRESERLNDTIRSFLAYARPQRLSIARFDVRRILNDAALLLRNSSEVQEEHVIDVSVPTTEVVFEADENQIQANRVEPGHERPSRDAEWRSVDLGRASRTRRRRRRDRSCSKSPTKAWAFPQTSWTRSFSPSAGRLRKVTGLGLAIVHRIVSDYGGEIKVTSTPGQGTTVSVGLPARAVAPTT